MKTTISFSAAVLLAIFLAGCGNKTEGPQEISSISSISAAKELPPTDDITVDTQPGLVKKGVPVYPEEAMKKGLEGTVYVKIWVDTEGKARDALIAKSDGEIFDKASLDAARQFQFTPATKDGKPVSVWIVVPFKYKLADKK